MKISKEINSFARSGGLFMILVAMMSLSGWQRLSLSVPHR